MRIIVLGSGVVGVMTAYYLAADGHEVVVLDRQAKAGLETSHANAGLIAPGHVYAWASPRAPKILLQSLWRSDSALKFRLKAEYNTPVRRYGLDAFNRTAPGIDARPGRNALKIS